MGSTFFFLFLFVILGEIEKIVCVLLFLTTKIKFAFHYRFWVPC